ncbi:FtsX domain-containing protein [Diplonema papillatum]|nr:FtsX domain-containing protein [Diplonema papillatum]
MKQAKDRNAVGVLEPIRMFFSASEVSARIISAELTRRQQTYVVGLLAVVVVVFIVSTLLGGIAKGPIIFMQLAEEQTGEMDMLFIKSNLESGEVPFLNFTDMDERTRNAGLDMLKGMIPRWYVTGSARKKWPADDNERAASADVTIMIADTNREEKISFGRLWDLRPLGEGECHVKDSILRELNLRANAGEHIIIDIDVQALLDQANLDEDEIISLVLNGSNNSLDFTQGLLDFTGLSDNDEVAVNVSALAGSLETLFGFGIDPIAPDNQMQTITIGELRDVFPNASFLTNGTDTSLTIADLLNTTDLLLDMSVAGSISSPGGKYPSAVGNAIVIDSVFLLRTAFEQLCYTRQRQLLGNFGLQLPELAEVVDSFDLNTVALTVVGAFNDRKTIYTSPKPTLDRLVVEHSDAIMLELDERFNATITYPVALVMEGFYFLRLLLDQIFNAVVVTITVLGCILIYSLLLADVEQKTYEHGMLRALGFRKISLINLMTMQALSFAVPGVCIAMILAFSANIVLEEAISSFSGFSPEYLDWHVTAIVVPIVIGICIPLLANVIPIRRAMGHSLRDALDISHQESAETSVSVRKLESLGLELWQTLLAIFMVVAGFIVYYMMPYSFIFNDLPLFFLLLLIILMAMLFGLCMVSASLQSVLETAVLSCLLWGKDRVLRSLISKNLAGHRSRSSRTYMMFTISTASIIFGGVVFTLQANSIISNIEVLAGADVQAYALGFYPLNKTDIDDFMREEKLRPSTPLVDWTYTTYGLNEYEQFDRTVASNLLFFPRVRQVPTGVERNFLNVVYDKYFVVEESQSGISKSEIIESLYTRLSTGADYDPPKMYSGLPPTFSEPDLAKKYREIIDVVASAGTKDSFSASVGTSIKLEVEYKVAGGFEFETNYIATPRALISKLPGYPFLISNYAFLLSNAPLLMSIDRFQMILEDNTKEPYLRYAPNGEELDMKQVYYFRVFVKLRDDVTSQERTDFVNELKTHIDRDHHTVLVAEDMKDSTQAAVDLLMTFFYVISTIAVLLNLFLLWTSFTTNVRQNAWAFAVMRSVGFTVDQLIKAYIYEALCTVLSALFCGLIIGILVALTLSAQFNMFLELPLDFEFPYVLFLIVCFEAVFSSVIGSWWPAQELKKREIAQVLKSQ